MVVLFIYIKLIGRNGKSSTVADDHYHPPSQGKVVKDAF